MRALSGIKKYFLKNLFEFRDKLCFNFETKTNFDFFFYPVLPIKAYLDVGEQNSCL